MTERDGAALIRPADPGVPYVLEPPMTLPASVRATVFALVAVFGCAATPAAGGPPAPAKTYEVQKTEAEWRAQLTPAQYRILREKDTERAFSGTHVNEHRDGVYACAGCGLALFDAKDKFESGTGWPSYTRPVKADAVEVELDVKYGMVREEVLCNRCGGHLGHVFDDGPKPTGKRYCINSESLTFTAAK